MKVGVPTEIKTDEYRVAMTPSGVRELTQHGHEVLVQAGAGEGSAITDDEYVAQGAHDPPRRRRRVRRRRHDRQGQGAPARRGRAPASRPGPLHLPAPRARRRADPGPDRLRRDVHRLRDGRGLARAPAAAGADERDRGQDRHAGRGVHAREAARRPRAAARRCPRRRRRQGDGHRRRGRRPERRRHRARHGRRGLRLRPQHRPPARARAHPQRPGLDVLRLDAGGRAAPARDGPRRRRGARQGRQGAARHHAGAARR